jgi:hypothetical protein
LSIAKPITFSYARAATNYRRTFICGGSFFFTANLAERCLRLLVDCVVGAKGDGFRCALPILQPASLELEKQPSQARRLIAAALQNSVVIQRSSPDGYV